MNRSRKPGLRLLGLLAVMVLAFSATSAPAAQGKLFTAAKYTASISGSSTSDEFHMFGTTVKCSKDSFATQLIGASEALTLTAKYTSCKWGTLPVTIFMNSCDYVVNVNSGGFSIACVGLNDAIEIKIYGNDSEHTGGKGPICHISMKPQGVLGTLTFANAGNDVNMSGKVKNIVATQSRTSGACPTGTDEKVGEYTLQAGGVALKAENGGAPVVFDIG